MKLTRLEMERIFFLLLFWVELSFMET